MMRKEMHVQFPQPFNSAFWEATKKTGLVFVACLLLLTIAIAQAAPPTPNQTVLEAKVRKAWEDFKNKDKESFAATLAGGFSEVEEDGSGFGDRKAILTMIDQLELAAYGLSLHYA
jgi:hypothetical protein